MTWVVFFDNDKHKPYYQSFKEEIDISIILKEIRK